jgi:hypothetical protein
VDSLIRGAVPPGKHLARAFDCVGVDISVMENLVEQGGSIALALPPTRPSLNHHVDMAIAGHVHDLQSYKTDDFEFHGGRAPQDSAGGRKIRTLMAWLMEDPIARGYKPGIVKRLSGKGMYDAFEAFQLMRAKKLSAQKVVWRMSETPGL